MADPIGRLGAAPIAPATVAPKRSEAARAAQKAFFEAARAATEPSPATPAPKLKPAASAAPAATPVPVRAQNSPATAPTTSPATSAPAPGRRLAPPGSRVNLLV